jgi:hypothetical protein
MTPEKQRIAIAEACGWVCETDNYYIDSIAWRNENERCSTIDLPDYLNDLNAMHEAEESLSIEQKEGAVPLCYHECLHDVVIRSNKGLTVGRFWYLAIHATAAQRAEAFLRTIGKWEEE